MLLAREIGPRVFTLSGCGLLWPFIARIAMFLISRLSCLAASSVCRVRFHGLEGVFCGRLIIFLL